jgi:hypothetical protein
MRTSAAKAVLFEDVVGELLGGGVEGGLLGVKGGGQEGRGQESALEFHMRILNASVD